MIRHMHGNISLLDKMSQEERAETNSHLKRKKGGVSVEVNEKREMVMYYFHKQHERKTEYKSHTHTHDNCMSPSDIYITFSTAVAFTSHSVAGFVSEDKVTPRVADGRSGPAGRKERGERRQRGRPAVTKVFGVRGRGSICSGLRGHCIAGRDLLPWCVLLSFSACGWIFISDWADFRTKRIYYS